MAEDGFLVNYHDAVVYERDLALLRPGQWLNDSCLWFFLTVLQREGPGFEVEGLPSGCSTKAPTSSSEEEGEQEEGGGGGGGGGERPTFLCVDPSVVSFLRLQLLPDHGDEEDEDELHSFGRQYFAFSDDEAQGRTVFIPVNDNASFDDGSSHWSLLVMRVAAQQCQPADRLELVLDFYHYDSHHGHNAESADAVASKFERVARTFAAAVHSNGGGVCHVADSPQQRNGYDCGMYALLTCRFLAQHVQEPVDQAWPPSGEDMAAAITPEAVTEARQQIAAMVHARA